MDWENFGDIKEFQGPSPKCLLLIVVVELYFSDFSF